MNTGKDFPHMIHLMEPFIRHRTPFNKPDAPNATMAPLFQRGHHWRGIGDPDRYTALESAGGCISASNKPSQ
jgi:hypothetical protein